MIRRPPTSTLLPYTTLSRSHPPDRRLSPEARDGTCLICCARPLPAPPTASRAGPRSSWSRTSLRFRSEEHTSELQSQSNLVCRLLLEKKNQTRRATQYKSVE